MSTKIPERNLYEVTAAPSPDSSPLTSSMTVDLAIVGAGMTGLSTALHAARRGLSVVVIEAQDIGHGGSGRNHGHCIPVVKYLDYGVKNHGFEGPRAARQRDLLEGAGRKVFELIQKYNLDCEAAQTGALHVAHHPCALDRLKRQHAIYAALGKADAFLDAIEVQALTGTSAYFGGWIHKEAGHLNPLGYTRGLAQAAIAEGAHVFTRTCVRRIQRDGATWALKTHDGQVNAKCVHLATNAYASGLGGFADRSFFTVRAYGIASKPIASDLRKTILPGNHNVGDTHRDVQFYRFDSANRLIVGGIVESGRGAVMSVTSRVMTERMQRLFPELTGMNWDWKWSGQLAMNLDMTPRLYRIDDGLFSMTGFSGRGVPIATAMGEIMADVAAGVPEVELAWPIERAKPLYGRSILTALVPAIRGKFNRKRDLFEMRNGRKLR